VTVVVFVMPAYTLDGDQVIFGWLDCGLARCTTTKAEARRMTAIQAIEIILRMVGFNHREICGFRKAQRCAQVRNPFGKVSFVDRAQPVNEPVPNEELDTWQEIAKYLGISVREAQYREKSDGLPVHRLSGKKPRVKAYCSELDAWRRQLLSANPASPVSTSPASGSSVQSLDRAAPEIGKSRSSSPPVSRRALLGSLAGAGAIAAAGAGWFFQHRIQEPARISFTGRNLFAWYETGRLAWQYQFPEPLRQDLPERSMRIVDLRGDGNKQIVVAASFPQDDRGPARHELYCFSSQGTLLWRYKPELAFTFGDTRFEGPWLFTDMIVVPDESRRTIWLAAIHWQLRPSFILAIDHQGIAEVKFVSAGHIYSLAHTVSPSGRYVLAGGVNNEYAAATLAILRQDAAPSRSPQTRGSRFECLDGPRGSPERYFLFPPSELTTAANKPYNRVLLIRKVDGDFVVTTDELLDNGDARADYGLSKDLEPHDVTFGDGYGAWHQRLEAEGRLKHTLAECPWLRSPISVQRWNQKSGWTTVSVPLTSGVRPDAHPR
jgi:hypothetical protein